MLLRSDFGNSLRLDPLPSCLSGPLGAPRPQQARQWHQNQQSDNGNHNNHDEYPRVIEVLSANHKRGSNITLCRTEREHALCAERWTAQNPPDSSTAKKDKDARQDAAGAEQPNYILDVSH